MANSEFTLQDVREVVEEVVGRVEMKIGGIEVRVGGIESKLDRLEGKVDANHVEVMERIDQVKNMLEEDFMAEAARVDKLERQLKTTRRELKDHIADKSVHK